MNLPEGKSRLDLVKAGLAQTGLAKRGRLVVSIERLSEDPKNERKTFRNMEGLIASIKAVGLIEPITVSPEGEGYRILTGHRRFRAAKKAGLTELEVLIREPDDALTRRRKSIVSNVQREDVGAVDLAEALQSLLEEDPTIKTQRELAHIIGKRESWVSDLLRILTLPPKLQEKLQTSEVSVSYDTVIRLARIKDRKQQEQFTEAALKGASSQEVRRKILESKGHITQRFSESLNGYTATVQGPEAPNAQRHMIAALEALLQKMHLNN
jgi:ParB family chromosome partitioning protein